MEFAGTITVGRILKLGREGVRPHGTTCVTLHIMRVVGATPTMRSAMERVAASEERENIVLRPGKGELEWKTSHVDSELDPLLMLGHFDVLLSRKLMINGAERPRITVCSFSNLFLWDWAFRI